MDRTSRKANFGSTSVSNLRTTKPQLQVCINENSMYTQFFVPCFVAYIQTYWLIYVMFLIIYAMVIPLIQEWLFHQRHGFY